jgi:hypothetical protein
MLKYNDYWNFQKLVPKMEFCFVTGVKKIRHVAKILNAANSTKFLDFTEMFRVEIQIFNAMKYCVWASLCAFLKYYAYRMSQK